MSAHVQTHVNAETQRVSVVWEDDSGNEVTIHHSDKVSYADWKEWFEDDVENIYIEAEMTAKLSTGE